MARTALPGRLTWRAATVTAVRQETPSARTLVLDIPDWPGHLPGQHLDLRLTAPDGYVAQRSYSIASAWPSTGSPTSPAPPASPPPAAPSASPPPAAPSASPPPAASPAAPLLLPEMPGSLVELTIQRLEDGEVSSYLTDVVEAGDRIEVRGPVGGWFVWRRRQAAPVLLVAGGSGIVPLMSMIRSRSHEPFRLIYSVRTPADAIYAEELARRVRTDGGLDVRYVYTRKTPDSWPDPPHRLDVATMNTHGWPPDFEPDVYICGPTGFVERAADMLVALGHDPNRIRTERFGGTS